MPILWEAVRRGARAASRRALDVWGDVDRSDGEPKEVAEVSLSVTHRVQGCCTLLIVTGMFCQYLVISSMLLIVDHIHMDMHCAWSRQFRS